MDFVGYSNTGIHVPMSYEQHDLLSCIVMQETSYQRNYVPTNEQTFDNRTLAPMNMNDSTVNI